MSDIDWDAYIERYHDQHPGITETGLGHARHPKLGTPHQWLAAALPTHAGDVVDLACGSCPLQPLLSYRTYLGVDRNEAELDAALSHGRGPVRLGDVTALDLPDASADTVVMSMALMLVPVEETLAEVHRVLRPGGVFGVMVPAMWPATVTDIPAVALLTLALRGPGSMPRTLGASVLEAQLRRSGFDDVTVARERFPFPIASAEDAHLAVTSLYTPGRSAAQLRRAQQWLTRLAQLPVRTELPVPLLHATARRRDG